MILIYAESQDGHLKKTAFEAVSYGKMVAESLGTSCAALVIDEVENPGSLGEYGADKVYQVKGDAVQNFDSQTYTRAIAGAADQLGAKVVIVSHSSSGKSLLGRLGVRLNAGVASGVNSIPVMDGSTLKVKKNVFSGKAIAEYAINSEKAVLSLMGNSFKAEATGSTADVESLDIDCGSSNVEIIELSKQEGDVAPLPEAELVVSAGRGMKGPENWGIIEELARELGATTACSRPVADSGWRPHHEHVGQTGIAIKPNLYIAAGISGAIQHLAGVNSSKCIVVINKDPEAPFFKAADYGICADLFDVVPRLTEAIKKAKS